MLKQFKHISAKTKILIFALLLIIIPSGFLGFLGFNSIEDRGLKLKENYRGLVQLLKDKLEGSLLSLEKSFLQDITSQYWDQDVNTIQHQLDQTQEQHPFIGDIFIMDAEGEMIHPDVILEAKPEAQSLQSIQAGIKESIDSGERSEFVNRDYPAAIRQYSQAMEQALSPQLRSYARMLVARCYFKMKNYQKAEEQYTRLVEEGEIARSSDGTPLKIIGLSQLSETYALLEQDQDKYHTLLELYGELIALPESFDSYDFYLQNVKNELNQITQSQDWDKSDLDRLENLREEEAAQFERVLTLRSVQRALLPRLDSLRVIDSNVPDASVDVTGRHLVQNSDRSPYQIGYVLLPPSKQQTGRQVLVYQIDKEFVLTELLSDTEINANIGNNLQLGIYSEEEPLAYPSTAPPSPQALSSVVFTQFFPSWRLALFDKKGKTVEHTVRKEKQLYGAALVGIFSIILIGAIMTLRAAVHEAEAARLKSEFVSNVSHELKTPLALIRLFGETLELDQVKDPRQRKKFSRIIARESQRLSHLIENVLDFSKIDSGRKEYQFEEADLVKVVSSTLEAYKFYLLDQGFEFVVSLPQKPIIMHIDKDALSQAVLNLLDNAEKYSKEGKYIGVEVSSRDGEAWISVEDRGPGISEPSLKRIFDQFYRSGDDFTRDVQGSGLGLTIVKHIVERHGGEIMVESEVGQGSRFTIKLPMKEERGVH